MTTKGTFTKPVYGVILQVWHSSHITNVINPTLVATHKKKLYKLEGELDALQMDNNGNSQGILDNDRVSLVNV